MSWEDVKHEVISLLIGAIGGLIWKKVSKAAKDLNCVFPRLRELEKDMRKLKGLPDDETSNGGCAHE